MTKRIEQARRHGHYDPRFVHRAGAATRKAPRVPASAAVVEATTVLPVRPRTAARPSGRYELRDSEGTYVGTFVTTEPEWHVGDTFLTGDGRRFRISEIVPVELIEVSHDRPAHALWEVEPA